MEAAFWRGVMTASVRRLMPDDAENLRAVRLEGLKLHPEAFSRDYDQDANLGLDEWRGRLASRAWFGGFVDNALMGLAAFSRGDSGKTAHTGGLGGMYVREAARGHGGDVVFLAGDRCKLMISLPASASRVNGQHDG